MSFDQGVQGLSEGAAIGTEIAPGIGTAIGGGLGLLAGLFGGDDVEAERQKRYQELLAQYNTARTNTLNRTFRQTASNVGEARMAAGERASALGRTGAAKEAFLLPSATGAMETGERAEEGVNSYYDTLNANAATDFANRPIEPSTLDNLVTAGRAVGGYFQGQRQLAAQYPTPGSTNTNSSPLALLPPATTSNVPGGALGSDVSSQSFNQETLGEFNPDTFDRSTLGTLPRKKKPQYQDESLSVFQDM